MNYYKIADRAGLDFEPRQEAFELITLLSGNGVAVDNWSWMYDSEATLVVRFTMDDSIFTIAVEPEDIVVVDDPQTIRVLSASNFKEYRDLTE